MPKKEIKKELEKYFQAIIDNIFKPL